VKKNILNEIARAHSNDGHSIFGPSSSHMWLVCAGSLIPNILAEDDGSIYAARGTVCHDLSEEWLTTGVKPKHRIGTTMIVYSGAWGYAVKIDHEMLDRVQESVDRCILLPGKHLQEQRVFFSQLTPIPDQSGTLDFAAIEKDLVTVVDHKYGAVQVYAERNPQAMMYALGLLFKYDKAFGGQHDFRRFRLVINQPYLDHYDEWECTRDDLLIFAGFVKERAKAAWNLDAPRTPDPKACLFCKVRNTCAANARMQFRLMADQSAEAFGEVSADEVVAFKRALTDDIEPFKVEAVDPLTLTTAELEALRPYKRMVEGWWKTADHELLRRGLAGVPLSRYKIVEGKSNRKFKNPDEAAAFLIGSGCAGDDVIEKSVVSPTTAEALLVKAGHRKKDLPDLLGGYIKKPPGKPTLAPMSDRRPAIEDTSAIAFGVPDDSTDETDNSEDY
jgi:hypothetical protein